MRVWGRHRKEGRTLSSRSPGGAGVRRLGETRQLTAALLREFGERSPVLRDGCLGGRHRDLGGAPGYERGKGDADRESVPIEGSTREQEPETSSSVLRSSRDTGIRWLETEMVRTLYNIYLFTELTGQGYQFSSTAGGDGSPQTSSGPRGQCRRDEEASPFEVEERVHELRIYALRRTVVYGVRHYSRALYYRVGPRVEKRGREA